MQKKNTLGTIYDTITTKLILPSIIGLFFFLWKVNDNMIVVASSIKVHEEKIATVQDEIKDLNAKLIAMNNRSIETDAKLNANEKQLAEHCGVTLFYDIARNITLNGAQ